VASARADKGDQLARREVASLGKQDVEVGRLVLSIERAAQGGEEMGWRLRKIRPPTAAATAAGESQWRCGAR